MQRPLFKAQTEWVEPETFPDLSKYDEIAIDFETKDPDLKTKGSASIFERNTEKRIERCARPNKKNNGDVDSSKTGR